MISAIASHYWHSLTTETIPAVVPETALLPPIPESTSENACFFFLTGILIASEANSVSSEGYEQVM